MFQRILVPIDGSPTSQAGLKEAIELGKLTQGRLRLVHVVDEQSFISAAEGVSVNIGDLLDSLRANGKTILDQGQATVKAAGLPVETILHDGFSGSVHETINTEASNWNADLIVIGTHGRRGIGRFIMGSSAENVLRYATVPVLLIRAPQTTVPASP